MSRIDPTLRRFLGYARPYRAWITGAALCGLLKFSIPLAFPLALKAIIDNLVSGRPLPLGNLHLLMLSLLAIYGVWAVVAYYRSVLADKASKRMIFDLRYDLYLHLQRLSLGFYEQRQVGAIASRLIGDVATAQNFVGAAFINTIMDLSTLVLIAVILLAENWQLALLSLSVLPLYAWLNHRFATRIKASSKLANDKIEEITGAMHEQLGAMHVMQANTREKTNERRFFDETREHLNYMLDHVHSNALAIALVGGITHAAPVLVIWFGAWQVTNGNLTTGGLVAFFAYLGMLYSPLTRLTELNIMLANSRSAMDRIFEVFDTAPDIVEGQAAQAIGRCRGDVEFKHVSFQYRQGGVALDDVSLHIPAGQTVALVGRSGAGKSTLAKLLPRFYDATSGSIAIDGNDIRTMQLKSLRGQIALVTQEVILFSGSIRDNLLYAKRGASEAEIVAATQAADAYDFIAKLPDGFDTVIGERGVMLSGGQRQRLALARAFLRDAPILIMDEATSALDSESENAIRRALQRLMRNRTTFVIAHRLSTVQSADQIIVFDNGRVVQQGRHEELMRDRNGLYHRLHAEQYGASHTPGSVTRRDDEPSQANHETGGTAARSSVSALRVI